MNRSVFILVVGSVLAACPGPKNNDPTATSSGSTSEETEGSGGTTTSTTSTTGEPTTGDTSTMGGTGSSGTTQGTSGGSSSGTTGGECMIELPDPGSCNKLVVGGGGIGGYQGVGPAPEPQSFGSSSTGGPGFIEFPDLPENTCDIYAQDCPDGQKCNAWSSDGDSSWDATGCFPIDPNPDPIGSPCTSDGGGVSGVDSCEKGAMCWGIDSQTGEGTCVELCTCAPDQPICTTPNTTCVISNAGVLNLCLPVCDPLDPDACGDEEVCLSNPLDGKYFICIIDASGEEGQAGDPCQYANACDPAHACLSPDSFPGCDVSEVGCCVPYCDLAAPNCPQGTECAPFYEAGKAPQCFEDVGICAGM